MVKIRAFEWNRDIDAVCAFHKDHVRINFPEQKDPHVNFFKDSLSDAYKNEPEGIFILEDNGVASGFLWLLTFYNKYRDQWLGQLNYVHIDEHKRGKGYGKKLCEHAEKYFTAKGIRTIRLSATAHNQAALKLFESLGYKPKKIVFEKACK